MDELAFLLFRVKEAAQVEDNGQKEHEGGHGDDGHRLLPGHRAVEALTPEAAGRVHLNPKAQTGQGLHLAAAEGQPPSGVDPRYRCARLITPSLVFVPGSQSREALPLSADQSPQMLDWEKHFHHNGS